MAEGVLEVKDSDFEQEVIKADKPVLVDFWAPWCGPCKAIGPIIETLAKDFKDQVKFVKCNVDDNPATPSQLEIRAIPTLILFKDGEIKNRITGMTAKGKLEDALNAVL